MGASPRKWRGPLAPRYSHIFPSSTAVALQGLSVPSDEGCLFFFRPAFELPLSPKRILKARVPLGVDEDDRSARAGVLPTASLIVLLQADIEILGEPDVIATVAALKDVDEVSTSQLRALRLAVRNDARSGHHSTRPLRGLLMAGHKSLRSEGPAMSEPREARRVEWWRRGDSHPRPKIHPRRNLRCVSASELSSPNVKKQRRTAGNQPQKISSLTSETPVSHQPA